MQSEDSAQNNNRVVILTALPLEYNAVRAHLVNCVEERHPKGSIYERGSFTSNGRQWDVLLVETGKYNPDAAIETERAIQHFNPDIALFVGIAGGMKDVVIGDVVAASVVKGYEPGKVGRDTFFPRSEVYRSTNDLVQCAKKISRDNLRNKSNPNYYVAPIASGEKVLASTRSELYKFIVANYSDVVAVDMEDWGFLAALYQNQGVSGLVIRGVSDLLKNKQKTDAQGHQNIAAANASTFAFTLLSQCKNIKANSSKPAINQRSPNNDLTFITEGVKFDDLGFQILFTIWNTTSSPIKIFDIRGIEHARCISVRYYGGQRHNLKLIQDTGTLWDGETYEIPGNQSASFNLKYDIKTGPCDGEPVIVLGILAQFHEQNGGLGNVHSDSVYVFDNRNIKAIKISEISEMNNSNHFLHLVYATTLKSLSKTIHINREYIGILMQSDYNKGIEKILKILHKKGEPGVILKVDSLKKDLNDIIEQEKAHPLDDRTQKQKEIILKKFWQISLDSGLIAFTHICAPES